MKYYCASCYKSTEYQFAKPKFCSLCGAPSDGSSLARASAPAGDSGLATKLAEMQKELDSLKKKPKTLPSKRERRREELEEDEYDDEGDEGESGFDIPDLKPGAGITIEKSRGEQGVSLGALVEQAAQEGPSPFPSIKRDIQIRDKKVILEELSREASSKANRIEIK